MLGLASVGVDGADSVTRVVARVCGLPIGLPMRPVLVLRLLRTDGLIIDTDRVPVTGLAILRPTLGSERGLGLVDRACAPDAGGDVGCAIRLLAGEDGLDVEGAVRVIDREPLVILIDGRLMLPTTDLAPVLTGRLELAAGALTTLLLCEVRPRTMLLDRPLELWMLRLRVEIDRLTLGDRRTLEDADDLAVDPLAARDLFVRLDCAAKTEPDWTSKNMAKTSPREALRGSCL